AARPASHNRTVSSVSTLSVSGRAAYRAINITKLARPGQARPANMSYIQYSEVQQIDYSALGRLTEYSPRPLIFHDAVFTGGWPSPLMGQEMNSDEEQQIY
ncbi:hypothetical protein LSH36_172g00013, partial [Paralvinella palmiformis]